MTQTPRIRNDLKATPAEEQGVKYFDVTDPRSGGNMRLYDFEWLIAERMDGARQFHEVASWAHERLGLNPSPDDLSEYAKKLGELGFFEDSATEALEPATHSSKSDVTPLPPPQPARGNGEFESSTSRTMTEPELSPELSIEAPDEDDPAPAPAPASMMSTPNAEVGTSTGKVSAGPSTIAAMEAAGVPKKSGSASMILLLVVILGVAGVFAYIKFLKPQSTHVNVMLASPREVVRLFDGAGAVRKADSQALSFGEAGKVTDVVAKGTEAKPGMPLATLESYPAVEKALNDVKDRAGFYQKQLDAAKAKGDEAAIKTAEGKVAEKKKLLGELEARAAKVRLIAPGTGTVTEVLVTAGGDAKAGEPAVKVGDKRMSVDFKLPAGPGEGGPKVGESVMLQPAAGGATLGGRVTQAANGSVTVELPDSTTAKPGDQLRLVKKKEQNVVPVPASAVVKRDDGDVVFVLSDGEAKLRKVTVVDRSSPTEVLISSGLATGDSVITSGADTLQDGQKASTQ